MRVDTAGNLWASAGAKIDVYAPDATLLGQIVDFPEIVANLTFGEGLSLCHGGQQRVLGAGHRQGCAMAVRLSTLAMCTDFQRRHLNATHRAAS